LVETNQTLQNFFGSLNGTVPMASKNVYLNGASGSPFQMGGCQGCHGAAGQSVGGDMSVIIGVAPYTSNTVPDPIDADLATSFLLAQKKLYDLPKPVISEPPPESEPPPSHHHGHHNHRPDH
jgi:hypothetical protein